MNLRAFTPSVRVAGVAAALWAVIALTGCSGMSSPTAKEPPAGIDITHFNGRWILDRQKSDDVRARLLPLFQREEQRWRHNAERFDDSPPRESEAHGNSADEGVSNFRWLQRERQKEMQALVAFAMPATQLDLHVGAHEVRISNNKGEGTRVLIPGESAALFVAVGGFTVASAWQDGGFTIDSRGEGENKIRVVERYRVNADGSQLDEQAEIHFPSIKKQLFHLVYRRE
jgi:hypothetical protein